MTQTLKLLAGNLRWLARSAARLIAITAALTAVSMLCALVAIEFWETIVSPAYVDLSVHGWAGSSARIPPAFVIGSIMAATALGYGLWFLWEFTRPMVQWAIGRE